MEDLADSDAGRPVRRLHPRRGGPRDRAGSRRCTRRAGATRRCASCARSRAPTTSGEGSRCSTDAMVDGFVERLHDRLDDDVIERRPRLRRRWSAAGRTSSTTPRTHRPRRLPSGQLPVRSDTDGATARRRRLADASASAPASTDLAYLLGGAFAPEHRAEVERDPRRGVPRPTDRCSGIDYRADDCWRDYRLGTLHGVLIAVIATVVAEHGPSAATTCSR